MTFGAMTWTCVLLSAAAAQPDVWYMNNKGFQIPIRFDAERRKEIRELDLYVSHDLGKSWNLAGRATPEKEFFSYAVTEDGPYWFTMAVIDLKGKQEPPVIDTAAVGQRMVVDTVKPDVKMEVDRQGDDAHVHWAITEEHPKAETLKLEYADSPEGPWTTVPIKQGPTGQADIHSATASVVRMQMQDMAENVGLSIKPIGTGAATANFTPPPPPPNVGPVVGPQPNGGPVVAPPPPPMPVDSTMLPPPSPTPTSVSKWTDRSAEGATHPTPPAPPVLSPGDLIPPPPPPSPAATPTVTVAPKGTGNQVVAFSPSAAGSIPTPPGGLDMGPYGQPMSHGGMPALQIVNKRQVKLEFDVGKFGPSGLGGADVYVTPDDGATWQKAVVDPNGAQLPAADVRNGAVRGSVSVQLASEGVTYGYYVVVKSKAGLGKPAPHPGDLPQIRVELDATPPEAVLIEPKADPSRRDTLILSWIAKDKNLTSTPITLEWAAQAGPDAQWNLIGPAELENTSHFEWQPTGDVPPNVYLRMTVRDTAGNKSVAQTAKPQLIDLSVPEVTNINLGGFGLK